MPKSENQKQKILYLLKILFEQSDEEHHLKMPYILSELERNGIKAERKSIYADVATLQDFGVDIMSDGHGYYLASRDFETAELRLLVDAIQASRFITKKKTAELISKIEKLASRHGAAALQGQVHIINRVKSMNESIYFCVDLIHNAISAGRKISFKYFEWALSKSGRGVEKNFRREGARYLVSPLALMWDDENYYLVAINEDGEHRHYRLDKMEAVCEEEERQDRDALLAGFDPAEYASRAFEMFDGKEEQVVMEFDTRFIGIVFDRFGEHAALRPADTEGRFRAVASLCVSPRFFAWLFGIQNAKIIGPEAVKEQYREFYEKAKP